MPEQFMSLREAREYLGISRQKIWRLVKDKELPFYLDPLDKRKRLVKRVDVERLKRPRPPVG